MNLRRRALSLAATAALFLALVPTPVLAAAIDACAPGGSGGDVLVGRDGAAREKDTGQQHKDLPARAKGKAPADFSVTVPVWFHVITDGSLGNLTSQHINAQIAVLDDGFDGREGGDDTGFSFTLAGVTSASSANVMQGSKIARAQSMTVMLAWAMLFGTLIDGSFAWITAGPPVIEPTAAYLGGVLYPGVIASAVTFPLYFNIIRAVGPGQAAWSSVLIPIIAMGFSTVFEDYHWAPLSIAGGAVALIGLVIAVAKRPERPSVSGNMVSVPVSDRPSGDA